MFFFLGNTRSFQNRKSCQQKVSNQLLKLSKSSNDKLFFHPFSSEFLDEAADINSNCDRNRLWCQCANNIICYVSWINTQFQSIYEKTVYGSTDLIKFKLLRIVFRFTFLLFSSSASSITNVSRNASSLC